MTDWVPAACTLPTAERPMRVAEFDELFAQVRDVSRPQPTQLSLTLPSDAEETARDLSARESQCCSFFTFEFEPEGESVVMRIGVPTENVDVLDALEEIAKPAPSPDR